MITDWITPTRVKILNAERLYPHGLDWQLRPGINAVIGGTSLGKTTFVYAIQYGIFEKMVLEGGERIEREFFKDRLTKRVPDKTKDKPPLVEIEFSVAGASYLIRRNLLTGALLEASCDGTSMTNAKYRESLADKIGLEGDFPSLARLQSHLLFFGEGRYLLAWDNLVQNELLNLLLSDHDVYISLNELWEQTESADSEARNISAQASRLDRDIAELGGSTNVKELARRAHLKEISDQRAKLEAQLIKLRKELKGENVGLSAQEAKVARAQAEFAQRVDTLESEISGDYDQGLLAAARAAGPTIASVRLALEHFFQSPNARPCPCCGRPGLSSLVVECAKKAVASAQNGACIVCSKDLESGPAVASASPRKDATDASATKLQNLLYQREQAKSRIASLRREESETLDALSRIRETELKYIQSNPTPAFEPLRVTVNEMRKRQRTAERRRDKKLAELRKALRATNAEFKRIQSKIAKAFKKYASLYLDEPCDVQLLQESSLPGRRGPQVKAPHAAFFPVVSGQARPSAQALSDAQRSFVDLAFRMAVIDVWHQQTGKTMTMIVETPEGAIDLAYMDRVATMLRTFSSQGHTLIVTTNLNNEFFLPELMAREQKQHRMERILNLIDKGRPHEVQRAHHAQFQRILSAVEKHPVAA